MAGGGDGFVARARGRQYDDVRDAWRHYLEHDNSGRGVVLVGHSQGSFILTELIRQEIDGKPVQARIVSAHPDRHDVGGAEGQGRRRLVQQLPLCRSPAQTGCVITFVVVPIDRAAAGEHAVRQGAPSASMVAACTNPAALGGGSG